MRPRHAVALVALVLGCTVAQKKAATSEALGDEGRRREIFEATLRVLDEKPEYVDEFFAVALQHRRTVDRFLADTTSRLADVPWLVETTAAELAKRPASLRRTMEATTDAALQRPASQPAYLAAMVSRKDEIARLLASDPSAAAEVVGAAVKEGAAGAAAAGALEKLRR